MVISKQVKVIEFLYDISNIPVLKLSRGPIY